MSVTKRAGALNCEVNLFDLEEMNSFYFEISVGDAWIADFTPEHANVAWGELAAAIRAGTEYVLEMRGGRGPSRATIEYSAGRIHWHADNRAGAMNLSTVANADVFDAAQRMADRIAARIAER